MNWYKKAQDDDFDEEENDNNSVNPHGSFAGKIFFHGTSKEGAEVIRSSGIDNEKSTKGYFGRGFYMAEEFGLAKSNYADFFEGKDEGVVLGFAIKSEAKILDLRIEEDFLIYNRISKAGNIIGRDDFDQIMVANDIDGLYDRSFGGIVIYNPNAVYLVH